MDRIIFYRKRIEELSKRSNKVGSFGTWLGFESKQRRVARGNQERRGVGPNLLVGWNLEGRMELLCSEGFEMGLI
jgi:hypothetical protein